MGITESTGPGLDPAIPVAGPNEPTEILESNPPRWEDFGTDDALVVRSDNTIGPDTDPEPAGGEEAFLDAGATVGDYVVESILGYGGMGVVYECVDPRLDRKVAVKVLRSSGPRSKGAARLLREARAMAKLTHPCVVTVHQVGEFAGGVFIVMELVEGETLEDWMTGFKSWDQILDRFRHALDGLAAAHEAGITHRDFKPTNVLIADDGRVLVTDFGLAAASNDADPDTGEISSSADASSTSLGERHAGLSVGPTTTVGTVLGTPAYMAPEQFAYGISTAMSDQFAFCVSLYRALYGRMPYPGDTIGELIDSFERRELEFPDSDVPRWLRRALARGLSVDPHRRFATARDLLRALHPPSRKRITYAAAALAAAGVIGGAAWSYFGGEDRASLCKASRFSLSDMWGAQTRQAVAASFEDTGLVYARPTLATVERNLDRQVEQIQQASITVCRDSPDAERPVRELCLEEARVELSVVVSLLVDADEQVVKRSVDAVSSLRNPSRCVEAAADELEKFASLSTADHGELAELEIGLIRSTALSAAGAYTKAIDIARDVAGKAREQERDAQLGAALIVQGLTTARMQENDAAEELLAEAVTVAEAAGNDVIKARAITELAMVVGWEQKRLGDGMRWIRMAEAALSRIGGDPEIESRLAITKSGVFGLLEDRDAELKEALRSYEIRMGLYGEDHPRTAYSMALVGEVYSRAGNLEKAEEFGRRGLAAGTRLVGTDHPDTALYHSNLGNTLARLGRFDEARKELQKALSIWTSANMSAKRALALTSLGSIEMLEDDPEGALFMYEAAVKLEAKEFGEHPILAETLAQTAQAHLALDQLDEADALLERAGRIWKVANRPVKQLEVRFYRATVTFARDREAEADAEIADILTSLGDTKPEQQLRASIREWMGWSGGDAE